MSTPRRVVPLIALAVLAAACSSSHSTVGTTTTASTGTTTALSTTTTTSSPTTTAAATTTAESTSTTTSTTIPAVKGLGLSSSGVGGAVLGGDPDGAITYVNSVLGSPTSDSGWTDPSATGLKCPGTVVRFVAWHDLTLFFSDQSGYAKNRRHFAGYTYGPAFGVHMDPYGLTTDAGIGVGSTVQQLKAAYPGAGVVGPSTGNPSPHFSIRLGLVGTLSGTKGTDTILSFVGGTSCSK